MRSQLFWDGNKRTSSICANKIMIENGNGIIKVPDILKNISFAHIRREPPKNIRRILSLMSGTGINCGKWNGWKTVN